LHANCAATFRFQAGHIPSWRESYERYALPPVAAAVAVTVAVSGWPRLYFRGLPADDSVTPWPLPQNAMPALRGWSASTRWEGIGVYPGARASVLQLALLFAVPGAGGFDGFKRPGP
jgi:hypothetical protein